MSNVNGVFEQKFVPQIEKSPYLSRGLSDFDKIWHAHVLRPSWTSQSLKFELSKIQDGGGRHLEKSKNVVLMDIINSLLKVVIKQQI